jgi:hypothetical protein
MSEGDTDENEGITVEFVGVTWAGVVEGCTVKDEGVTVEVAGDT